MINIHKGEYFKSKDNKQYIFIGYKNPHIIYCTDDNFSKTNEILLFDVDIIDSPLNIYNETVKNLNWYYESEEELNNTNLDDKINLLLVNMKNDFSTWEKEVSHLKLDIRIKKISDLVKGKAYYSSKNEYYEIVGFVVDTETYEKGKKIEENRGIFSIYHSKCDNLAPMTFFYNDSQNSEKFFNKSSNDFVIVDEVLMKESDIQQYIQELGMIIPSLSDKETKGMELI